MEHDLITNLRHACDWPLEPRWGALTRGRMPDPDLPARLMTPERLVDILMRHAFGLPGTRCLRNGEDLHPNRFTTTVNIRRGPDAAVIDPQRLAGLLRDGVTLVADAVNHVDPTIEVACRAMRWWTGELVRANFYLTTGAAPGFTLHWDDHDVLIVQLSGEKRWDLRPITRLAPMYRDVARDTEPPQQSLWTGTLRAGDVLHIPRGMWHCATRQGMQPSGHSLHMTLGFTRRTGVNWLDWVTDDKARGELILRTDLPTSTEPDHAHQRHRGLIDTATRLLSTHSPDQMLTERRATHAPARHVNLGPMFGEPDAVIAITEFEPEITVHDDRATVRGAGREITCTPTAEPLLRLLLSGHPVRLDGPDAPALRALATTLLKEGLCAPMTDALWSGCTGLLPTVS